MNTIANKPLQNKDSSPTQSVYLTVRLFNSIKSTETKTVEKVALFFAFAIAMIVDSFVFIFGNTTAGIMHIIVNRGLARTVVRDILKDPETKEELANSVAKILTDTTVIDNTTNLIKKSVANKELAHNVAETVEKTVEERYGRNIKKCSALANKIAAGVVGAGIVTFSAFAYYMAHASNDC